MSSTLHQKTSDRPVWVLVLALTAAGVVFRSWNLAQESFWLDELSAIAVSRQTWGGLAQHLALHDVHPPLYFVLLKLWGQAFGFGEIAARSLSVIVGAVAIPSGAALAGALCDRLGLAAPRRRQAILVAAALLAASPFAIYYAREARGYSLLLALATLSTWLLVRALPACRARDLIAYAIVAAALPYTHIFGIFTLGAHGLCVLVALGTHSLSRPAALRVLLAQVVSVLAYLPWLPVTLAQIRRVSKGFWVPPPTPELWLRAWLAEGPLSLIWVVATTTLAAVAIVRIVRTRRDLPLAPALIVLALAGLLLPSIVPIAMSTVMQPIFVPKYGIGAAALLLVLAAITLATSRTRGARVLLVALPLVGALEAGRDVFLWRHKEDWRALAELGSREARAGTPLVHTVNYHAYLRHYLDPAATLWQVGEAELTGSGPKTLAARLAAAGRDRFWMLNVHPPIDNPTLDPLLRARWRPVRRETFFMAEAVLWVDVAADPGHTGR